MKYARKFVGGVFLLLLLVDQGCDKKKNTGLPRQAQAPTVAVVLPDEIPLTEGEPEEAAPQVPEAPPAVTPAKTKPRKPAKNSSTAKKATSPAPTPASNQNTQNTQVASAHPPKNPADTTSQAAIAAAIPDAKVVQQKEETTKMVDSTENALKGLTRSLNDEEKAMRAQIQSYLQQSRKATNDGDFERAYNLAKKAQVLTEALLKK
jgi:hypothetical protein